MPFFPSELVMITSAQYSDAETTKDNNKSNDNNNNSSTIKITNTRILFSKLFLVAQPESRANQGVIMSFAHRVLNVIGQIPNP